jgi:hypothetical protein
LSDLSAPPLNSLSLHNTSALVQNQVDDGLYFYELVFELFRSSPKTDDSRPPDGVVVAAASSSPSAVPAKQQQ